MEYRLQEQEVKIRKVKVFTRHALIQGLPSKTTMDYGLPHMKNGQSRG
jgi:hypothetical protein